MLKFSSRLLAALLCGFFTVNFAFPQSRPQSAAAAAPAQDNAALRRQALDFAAQNQYGKALPIFEKIYDAYPNDVEVVTHYGIALMTTAVTSKDPAQRQARKAQALKILKKAEELGTDNQIALHTLENLEKGNGDFDISFSENKEVENLLREGEAHFSNGEYDKAFVLYEKAFKLDPKSYEAALFAGDCFYAQRKYAESEPWFAKAAAIDPNREQAFRFWGDALALQKKYKEAGEKFAEAVIAEPYSRLSWNSLQSFVKEYSAGNSSFFVLPPAEQNDGQLTISEQSLKAEDGTIHWKKLFDSRSALQEKNGENFVPDLAEDVKAFKEMARLIRLDLKSGKIKSLDPSLANLLKLDEMNMIDIYTLYFLHNGGLPEHYEAFRDRNRARMRRFFVEYVMGFTA